jgi:hypothetical protein
MLTFEFLLLTLPFRNHLHHSAEQEKRGAQCQEPKTLKRKTARTKHSCVVPFIAFSSTI